MDLIRTRGIRTGFASAPAGAAFSLRVRGALSFVAFFETLDEVEATLEQIRAARRSRRRGRVAARSLEKKPDDRDNLTP
jgi:hypothetical protein